MFLFYQSESTAARRRLPLYLVDADDGETPETGLTFSAGDVKISKNGAAEANHGGSFTELAGGQYYYEATQAELDTLGFFSLRVAKSGVRALLTSYQVIAVNLYDGVRAGLTALPDAAAEAAGGLFTRGTGAGQINQAANGMIDTNPVRLNNVSQSLLDLKDFADDGYDPSTNKVQGVVLVDTLTTYTGNTPQTGDAFARLGAPAGASVSADVAAVKAETASIQVDTDNIQTRLPAALVGGRMDSSVGAMAANTFTASALAADAVTEIQSGLSTLDAAGVRSAVGLASANLDTQLDALPTATENADALLDRANGIETGVTLRQAQRLQLSANVGKLSGAATTTVSIRDTADSKNRIVATVDASGNRTAVTLDSA